MANIIQILLEFIAFTSLIVIILISLSFLVDIPKLLKRDLNNRKELTDQRYNLFQKYYYKTRNKAFIEKVTEELATLLVLSNSNMSLEKFIVLSMFFSVVLFFISLSFIKIFMISMICGLIGLLLPLAYVQSKRGRSKRKINAQVHQLMRNSREVSPRCTTPREIIKLANEGISNPLNYYVNESVKMMEVPIETSLIDIATKIGDRDFLMFANFMRRKRDTSSDYYRAIDNFLSIISNHEDINASNTRIMKTAISRYRTFLFFFISDFVVFRMVDPSLLQFWHTDIGKIALLVCIGLLVAQGLLTLAENYR